MQFPLAAQRLQLFEVSINGTCWTKSFSNLKTARHFVARLVQVPSTLCVSLDGGRGVERERLGFELPLSHIQIKALRLVQDVSLK